MAKLSLKQGTTSKLIQLFILNSIQTDGSGLNTLVWNSSGLSCYFYREGTNASAVVTLTNATLGTYTAGGFISVDTTNMNGCYQLGVPNAALASGANSVVLLLKGAANMAQLPVEIELTQNDNQDGTAGGISRLDAAITTRLASASTAANFSVLDIDSNGQIDISKVRGNAINALISGRIDANASAVAVTAGTVSDKTGYSLTQTFPTNFSTLSIDGNGRILYANTVNLIKNQAFSNFPFFMVDSADHVSPRTSAVIAATRSLDGASFGATANTASEIANGWYKINLAATDLNGNSIALRLVGTGCDITNLGIVTNI